VCGAPGKAQRGHRRRLQAEGVKLLFAGSLDELELQDAKNSRAETIEHGQRVCHQHANGTHHVLDCLILVGYRQLVVQDVLELFGSWAQPEWGCRTRRLASPMGHAVTAMLQDSAAAVGRDLL
jgi:hypothetical protein